MAQLDFGDVIDRLNRDHGYNDDMLDTLGEHIHQALGIHVVNTVTAEQLSAAGVPNRVVFALRRAATLA